MRTCLFVGSFNPVTLAHQKIAYDLLEDKVVDYLYFLPVNSMKNVITIEDRIKLLNLIKTPKMEVLNIYDYEKEGLFNFQVLEKINKQITINYLVMGSDLFLKLKTFANYRDIIKKYKIILIPRNEIDLNQVIKENYNDYKDNFLIREKTYNGSSTKARLDLKKRENIYLDKKVLDYIKKNHLYN